MPLFKSRRSRYATALEATTLSGLCLRDLYHIWRPTLAVLGCSNHIGWPSPPAPLPSAWCRWLDTLAPRTCGDQNKALRKSHYCIALRNTERIPGSAATELSLNCSTHFFWCFSLQTALSLQGSAAVQPPMVTSFMGPLPYPCFIDCTHPAHFCYAHTT